MNKTNLYFLVWKQKKKKEKIHEKNIFFSFLGKQKQIKVNNKTTLHFSLITDKINKKTIAEIQTYLKYNK